jgi:UDP-glucose 4-epimerase
VQITGKRVVVTGAEGFIGSHLCEAAVRAGAKVTALSLYDAFGARGWLDTLDPQTLAEMVVARGDLRDSATIAGLFEGADMVFHLGALIAVPYSYQAVQSYIDVNIKGTVNVLEAARTANVARIVHTSTSEVYGTAQFTPITEDHPYQGQSPYAATKIAADMMAQAYALSFDLPVVILRPFNTYGPRQSERAVIPTVIRQALDPACHEIVVGDRTPKRDFTFVADTVSAFLAAAGAKLDYGVPYNCGTGTAVTIGHAIDKILEITGCNKPVRDEAARRRPDKSEVRELRADASRFSKASGWRAETTLEAGLVETIGWWRERIAANALRADASYLT